MRTKISQIIKKVNGVVGSNSADFYIVPIQEFLYEVLNELKSYILLVAFCFDYFKLAMLKGDQKKEFELLKKDFCKSYKNLKKYDLGNYVTEDYKRVLKKLERSFIPNPRFFFLANASIRYVMHLTKGGKFLKDELSFLESIYSEDILKDTLTEDYVGRPTIMNSKYLTSHNSVNHFYELTLYKKLSGCDLNSVSTVVEWGGGYGSLARIYKRFINKKTTYIIFDVPLFSCVQWLYLSTIFGRKNTNLLEKPTDAIQEGKINLIPIVFRDLHQNIKSDLFISTYALSESGRDAQDFIVERCKWFNCSHLLLCYSNNSINIPDSTRIGEFAKQYGAKIKDSDILPGNYYAYM